MKTISYKIKQLDCAEEANLLKKGLKSAQGVQDLEFDILAGKMSVVYDPELIQPTQILELIQKTGMDAIHWEEREKESQTFWSLYGRLTFTLLSGLLLLLGFILKWPSLYLVSTFFGALYVTPKAFFSLRQMSLDINLLMLLACIGAIAIRQWFEAATVAFLFSLSLYLEQWSVGQARKAIRSLVTLAPTTARVKDQQSSNIEEREVESIAVGSTIVIRPGEKIPLDALIIEGSSFVNQAAITGESTPIFKQEGESVFAGTLNGNGALVCRVTQRYDQTTLAKMIHLIEESRSKRSQSEQWVEIFARYYTPIMLFFAVAIMVLPPLLLAAPWSPWIYRGLVLLVIACPCALVISTPVSIVCGLTAAARAGVLIKGGLFLELLGQLKALAMDKTGTLTYGHPEIQKIIPLNQHSEEALLERGMALEKLSEHPFARAIIRKGEERGLQPETASNYQAIRGKGALATYKGKLFWIGSHRFMHEMGQETEAIHNQALALEDAGHSVVAIGNDDHVCGLLSIADAPRDKIGETISSLKALGIEQIVMLTGDNEPTAKAIAAHCGITHFRSELLPEEKVDEVIALGNRWGNVAMVGDGINDAPAMAAATMGIAMGGVGSDVAIETADITLMGDDLGQLPWLIHYSRRVLRIIKQNIGFALGIKGLFIALALFNLATLWMAIAADTGATILVTFNALRLLHKRGFSFER